MCDKQKLVPIPDHLRSHVDFDAADPEFGVDVEGRQCISMDECIVPILETLWAYGVITMGCCCGHGSGRGVISLKTEAYANVIPQEVLDQYCQHNWMKWECPTCNSHEKETLKQECALPPAEEAGEIEAGARQGTQAESTQAEVCAKCCRPISSMTWLRDIGGKWQGFHYGCLPRAAKASANQSVSASAPFIDI